MKVLSCPVPENINPLQPNNFVFSVHKLPDLTFFVQTVDLPGLTLGQANVGTPLSDIPVPGDKLDFGTLTCSFIVDERFANYGGISRWMMGLGYPENHAQYRKFLAEQPVELHEHLKTVSDATLGILDSSNNALATYTFVDCFPISLSGIGTTTTATDIPPVTATVTFAYNLFSFTTKYDKPDENWPINN